MKPNWATGGAGQRGAFATTRWSVILSSANSREDEQKAHESLTELCRLYWRPIFAFVCRRGYPVEDAEDLTQDFFVMILETKWLEHADPNRGRFRSLLLRTLQNFVGQAAEKRLAQKRGGKVKFVSWDDWMAEAPSRSQRLQSVSGCSGPSIAAVPTSTGFRPSDKEIFIDTNQDGTAGQTSSLKRSIGRSTSSTGSETADQRALKQKSA